MQEIIVKDTDHNPQGEVSRVLVSISPLVSESPRSTLLLTWAVNFWHISSTSLRSAYHHWRIRIATNRVDFGPALRRLPDGSLQPEKRTLERSRCIDNLLATRPWADSVDIQMFLEGFDAGEQWYLHTSGAGSEHSKHAEA